MALVEPYKKHSMLLRLNYLNSILDSENVSRNSSPFPGMSIRTRHESYSNNEPVKEEASATSLHKAGSLISMTSQVN